MLDALHHGGDLERYLDVDGFLRYLAASTVMANFDSYAGPFAHNYYLYEQNGRFTVLPWDFNMSFSGMGMGQANNVKIDEPTAGALSERPLIAKLLAVPEYRDRYHGYLQALITGYLNPEPFEARARAVAALIDPYVKDDPTKFYTYEEVKRSLEEGVSGTAPGMPGAPAQAPVAPVAAVRWASSPSSGHRSRTCSNSLTAPYPRRAAIARGRGDRAPPPGPEALRAACHGQGGCRRPEGLDRADFPLTSWCQSPWHRPCL